MGVLVDHLQNQVFKWTGRFSLWNTWAGDYSLQRPWECKKRPSTHAASCKMQCVRRHHFCKNSLSTESSPTDATNFNPSKTLWTMWTCWLWDAALELSNPTSQSLDWRQNSWRLFEHLRYKWDEKDTSVLYRHSVCKARDISEPTLTLNSLEPQCDQCTRTRLFV